MARARPQPGGRHSHAEARGHAARPAGWAGMVSDIRRPGPKPGYALLMVLLVLVVAAAVLSAAARRCADSAVRAYAAQRNLQVHWGALGCRATVLPMAEELLDASATPTEPIIQEARRAVVLGGMRFNLIVSDEQAKANAGALAALYGDDGLKKAVRKLQAGGRGSLEVRLRPVETSEAALERPVRYASLDQVFVLAHPSQWIGPEAGDGAVVRRRLTCWGPGRINLKRAEVVTLREALGGALTESQLASLDDIRRREPEAGVQKILSQLQLTRQQLETVGGAATDRSACHSLWICVEDRTRRWYRLFVEEADGASERTYSW